jgi:hypothetical protein
MLRRAALVRTGFSQERSASIIRVPRIGELGSTLAVISNVRTHRSNTVYVVPSSRILVILMMEAVCSSETSVLTSVTGITFQKTALFKLNITFFIINKNIIP